MEAMNDSPSNKGRRMRLMRRQVVDNDIYKWANTFLDDLERLTRTPEASQEAG
jgi:trehalose-6-phosphate synthase